MSSRNSSTSVPSQISAPMWYAALPMTCAATGAVNRIKIIVVIALVNTSVVGNIKAAPITNVLAPREPAFVEACILMRKSGKRRIPMDAISINVDPVIRNIRSEEHTSELQSRGHLVCRLLIEKKKKKYL